MAPQRDEHAPASEAGLRRVLGPFDVTMFVMGSIIGAGVFHTPARVATQMGSTAGVLAVWAFGGVIALSGALVFAELGAMLPRTGGEYVFVRAGAGRLAAFLFGWMSLSAIISSAIAYVAGVFVEHLELVSRLFDPEIAFSRNTERLLAVAVIVGLAAVNARGTRLGATVQNVAMLAKIAGIATVILLGAVFVARGREPVAPTVPLEPEAAWTWSSLGAALFGIVFTYGGWQNVAAVATEIRRPERNLPLGTLVGTVAVVALYLALNLALIGVLGVDGVARSSTPVASAAGAVVAWGEPLAAVLVMVSTFAITQALLMLAPRIYVAMADDGVFFRGVGRVHAGWGTPVIAIALQAGFAALHVVVAEEIGDLIEVCSICDWVFFTICGATLFVLRVREPGAPRPYRAWGYPWTPAIFLACSAAVLVRMIFSAKLVPGLQAAGLFFAGVVLFALWSRRSPAPRDGR